MGNKISREAAEHMARHRVRCNQCAKIFCASCNADPYHIGKTCEEFKDFKTSLKCRFCWEKLTEPSISKHAALQDCCRKPECIKLMKQSCSKTLPCGHSCRGFRKEPKCLPCLMPECVEKNEQLTLG